MLSMDVDKGTAQLFEDSQRTEATVQIYPMPAGPRQDPLEDNVVIPRADDILRPKLSE
jgi:hypothetical protein